MDQLNPYFRRLNQELDCPRAQKKVFLADAQRMAEDFLQGNPDAAPEEVKRFLGEPRELAQTYLDSLDPDVLARYRTRKTWTRRIAVGLTATVIVLLAVWVAYLRNHPHLVEVSETLIIYPEEKGLSDLVSSLPDQLS